MYILCWSQIWCIYVRRTTKKGLAYVSPYVQKKSCIVVYIKIRYEVSGRCDALYCIYTPTLGVYMWYIHPCSFNSKVKYIWVVSVWWRGWEMHISNHKIVYCLMYPPTRSAMGSDCGEVRCWVDALWRATKPMHLTCSTTGLWMAASARKWVRGLDCRW